MRAQRLKRLAFVPALCAAAFWLAAASAAQPAGQGPRSRSQADVLAWAGEHLHLTGWTYLNHTEGAVRFISRPYRTEGLAGVIIKMRVEEFEPAPGRARSVLSEVEIDCAKRRTRLISSIGFQDQDFRAPVLFRRSEPDQWRDPRGTVMDDARALACRAEPAKGGLL